MDEELLRTLKG